MPDVAAWEPFEAGTVTSKLVDALGADPARWLPEPATERGPAHWEVILSAGPVARSATVAVGPPSGDDHTVVRQVRWRADPEPTDAPEEWERALPSFDGHLAVQSDAGEWPQIRLEGRWEPPAGPIGAALGPEQLQALAEAMVQGFVRSVAARLVGGTSRS